MKVCCGVWDYKAGLVVGISDRIGYLNSGAVDP